MILLGVISSVMGFIYAQDLAKLGVSSTYHVRYGAVIIGVLFLVDGLRRMVAPNNFLEKTRAYYSNPGLMKKRKKTAIIAGILAGVLIIFAIIMAVIFAANSDNNSGDQNSCIYNSNIQC
jgi:formate/nitrite transporter FocA (FNT family)